MQRRVIAAIIILGIVVAVYFTGQTYIKNTCKEANELLESCDSVYKADKNAKKDAKKLQKFWTDNEGKLSVFANHQRIDDIELAISSLVTYSDTDDNKIYDEYSSTVKTLLHLMIEDISINMHSIL